LPSNGSAVLANFAFDLFLVSQFLLKEGLDYQELLCDNAICRSIGLIEKK